MSQTKIYLSEHSKIPESLPGCKDVRQLCYKIQQAIKDGKLAVTNLTQMFDGKVTEENPVLFKKTYAYDMTQEYVGFVTYEGVQVCINSRFDRQETAEGEGDNQFFIRFLVEQIQDPNLKLLQDHGTQGGVSDFDFFLVPMFLVQVKKALSMGAFRQYRYDQHNSSRFRGTLDISRHIKLNPLNNGKLAFHTREYTVENAINQLIVTAAFKLSKSEKTKKSYYSFLKLYPDIGRSLAQLQRQLPVPSLKQKDVLFLLQKTCRPITHPLYYHYEVLRKTAHTILSQKEISITENTASNQFGVVFSMDKVWEKLLEQRVFHHFPDKNSKSDLPKYQNDLAVFQERVKFRPDVLVTYDNGEQAVFDAKNKPLWEETWWTEYLFAQKLADDSKEKNWSQFLRTDIFQIISYLYVTKSDFCGAVFPVEIKQKIEKEKKTSIYILTDLDYEITKRKVYQEMADFYFIPIPIPVSAGKSFSDYTEELRKSLGNSAEKIRNIRTVPDLTEQQQSTQIQTF